MNIQDRIKMVIKMHNLTSSAFADKIGVQRSSVSHILTGRNNPSLDFIEKTLSSFPRVNADWLIMGKASNVSSESTLNTNSENEANLKSEDQGAYTNNVKKVSEQKSKSIDRIIVFYNDGTFEETRPTSDISAE